MADKLMLGILIVGAGAFLVACLVITHLYSREERAHPLVAPNHHNKR